MYYISHTSFQEACEIDAALQLDMFNYGAKNYLACLRDERNFIRIQQITQMKVSGSSVLLDYTNMI